MRILHTMCADDAPVPCGARARRAGRKRVDVIADDRIKCTPLRATLRRLLGEKRKLPRSEYVFDVFHNCARDEMHIFYFVPLFMKTKLLSTPYEYTRVMLRRT